MAFHGFDNSKPKPNPIYHTNVIMAMLDKHVIFCLDSIHDPKERAMVLKELKEDREVIDISYQELGEMCGNAIMVKDATTGDLCLVLSQRALKGFTPEHRKILESSYRIVASDIKMIEIIGGGSARCMVAELF